MPRSVELFLGGLSKETRRADLEDIFSKYGKITRCDIKYVNGYAGTAYGFIGYDNDRDAEDAIKYENGRKICGQSVVIERSKTKPWNKGSRISTRGGRDDSRSNYGYRRVNNRSYSRSRSRSRDRRRRYRSRTRSRSRSRSRSVRRRHRRNRSRSRTRSNSRSRSRSRSSRERRRYSRSRSVERQQSPVKETNIDNQTDKDFDLHEENCANGIYVNDEGTLNNQTNGNSENNGINKTNSVEKELNSIQSTVINYDENQKNNNPTLSNEKAVNENNHGDKNIAETFN